MKTPGSAQQRFAELVAIVDKLNKKSRSCLLSLNLLAWNNNEIFELIELIIQYGIDSKVLAKYINKKPQTIRTLIEILLQKTMQEISYVISSLRGQQYQFLKINQHQFPKVLYEIMFKENDKLVNSLKNKFLEYIQFAFTEKYINNHLVIEGANQLQAFIKERAIQSQLKNQLHQSSGEIPQTQRTMLQLYIQHGSNWKQISVKMMERFPNQKQKHTQRRVLSKVVSCIHVGVKLLREILFPDEPKLAYKRLKIQWNQMEKHVRRNSEIPVFNILTRLYLTKSITVKQSKIALDYLNSISRYPTSQPQQLPETVKHLSIKVDSGSSSFTTKKDTQKPQIEIKPYTLKNPIQIDRIKNKVEKNDNKISIQMKRNELPKNRVIVSAKKFPDKKKQIPEYRTEDYPNNNRISEKNYVNNRIPEKRAADLYQQAQRYKQSNTHKNKMSLMDQRNESSRVRKIFQKFKIVKNSSNQCIKLCFNLDKLNYMKEYQLMLYEFIMGVKIN